MSDQFKLLCLVQGDELKRAFSVRVEPADTVSHLKEVIHSKKPSFKGIDANALQLWKVSTSTCYGNTEI